MRPQEPIHKKQTMQNHLTQSIQTYKLTVMKKQLTFFAIYILCFSLAYADQCEWVSWDVAEKAYNLLLNSLDYTHFCAPCMDKEPITKQINTVDIKPVDRKGNSKTLYQILINNKPIDIAYVYINGKNLGMQADCTPIGDVPEYIDDFLTGRWHLDETAL